jgi:hypothetical protein
MDSTGKSYRSQADLMRRVLSDYEAGRTSLPRLIANSEAVIESLSEISDSKWIKELRQQWEGLEIPHALMLDEGRVVLTEDEQREVNQTVAKLYSMFD